MTTQTKTDLIGFGVVAVDDLLFLENFPREDTKTEVKTKMRYAGGLAGTALVAASRLGANSSYFGVLGKDELSRFTIREFKNDNVDISLCIKKEDARPFHSTIIVDISSGVRTILYSKEGFQPPPIKDISLDKVKDCKCIFIDSFVLEIFSHLIQLAHSIPIPIVADIESDKIKKHSTILNSIDHLILNIEVASKIVDERTPSGILHTLDSEKRICSVLTDGANGCWFKEKNLPVFHMPAYKVNTVDTTGCGDVFHGAYAAAIIRGEDISTAVRQASAAAAMKATKPGGRQGIPFLKDLLEFCVKNKEINSMEISS